MSIAQNLYLGTSLNVNTVKMNDSHGSMVTTSTSASFVLGGSSINNSYNSQLSIYSLNNTSSGNYELINLGLTDTSNGYWNLNTSNGGIGKLRGLNINTGLNGGIYLGTDGNIGINTTVPQFNLDIDGILNVKSYSYINGLQITNTDDALDMVSTGALLVSGGATVDKNLNVNGLVAINNTSNSSNTQGALTVAGGISILSGQSSNFGSGALTVAGGGYFGGEVYIQQNLNVNGQINGGSGSSSTFSYLTLTATDQSINLSSGTLVSFGGITLQCFANSQNVSNGGSFLTPGGISVGKDFYLGGSSYIYGITNLYASNNNLIKLYDTSNILRFSIDRSISSNNFSISRYNSLGALVEKSIEISNQNGMITLYNSTSSTNLSSGSLITNGGITIKSSTNSISLNNGGALTVMGGTSISQDMYVGGNTVFSSTTDSTSSSSGSVIFYGGVGIGGNLNVLGNTVISGNLTIIGTTTSVQSSNTFLKDNIILLNSGPSGSKDSGFLIQRYQSDNNSASGDVVADNPYIQFTLPNQSGMSSTQIKLPSNASSIDNSYTGWWIEVTSGFSSNQVRQITAYSGTSKIATITSVWNNQNPAIGDSVSLFNKPYVGIIYSEANDRFEFCGTAQDGTLTSLTRTDTLPIYFSSATSTSTQPSTNSTTGAIIVSGGISSSCTTDAYSTSYGGSLTVAGGAAIQKTLYVGNKAYINGVNVTPNAYDICTSILFNAANNMTNFTDITGLNFGNDNTVWGVDLYLSVQVIATTNYYSNYQIRAVFKQSYWDFVTSYVGDAILTFNITSSGQVQYKTPNFDGFVSCIFKYRAITN
jgi:hypothetical protein